jgi:hypothetical protein
LNYVELWNMNDANIFIDYLKEQLEKLAEDNKIQ